MHLLSLENASKSYGERILFQNIDIHINEGDKAALIARNGQGKTSLLNIIAELDQADSGTLWIRDEIKLIYLKQENNFPDDMSIKDVVLSMDHPIPKLVKKYNEALIEGSPLDDLNLKMEELDAWSFETYYNELCGKLNLDDLEQKTSSLSGGQQKRLALVQALLEARLFSGKCLFILDEPTNHLDIAMIEWLENKLSTDKTTLLLVSHDRWFIDTVCNRIIEIEDNKAYSHPGSYEEFLENKAHRVSVAKVELGKSKNLYKKELEWMRRQPKARTTKSKSREDSFHDIEKKVKGKRDDVDMALQVKMNRLGGKILEMKKVYKSYGDKVMLKGFDYSFKKGERIGIVGANGSGKSTLLKIALGIEAQDSGKVNRGETVVFGHFSQDGLAWEKDMRVIEYVKTFAEYFPLADGSKLRASAFLERFAFPPKQQHTFLSKLSGGEKRRLQLLSILFKNPNFLVLDEPTNDLDLQTLQILEEFLLDFPGCLILVSHDRFFMDKLVEHLFVLKGDGEIEIFPGNYSQYRALESNTGKKKKTKVKEENPQLNKSNQKKNKVSYKDKREFEEIEKQLPLLEEKKRTLEDQLSQNDLEYDKLQEISIELSKTSQELQDKEFRWLELSELF